MTVAPQRDDFRMEFDTATIKHLGLQMYSSLPAVISEILANSWDANATKVHVSIPVEPIQESHSEIIISDNGTGMTDQEVREKYLTVGRDRRDTEQTDTTEGPYNRKVMGRKGIGKFSAFGIASEIEVETVKDGQNSRFRMNYNEMLEAGSVQRQREISFPPLEPSGEVERGTRIILRKLAKYNSRRISLQQLRSPIARRFSVIGYENQFQVSINGKAISPTDRDLKKYLDVDVEGDAYLWKYDGVEIQPDTGWKVSGWIGALKNTASRIEESERGIVIMARGKLVQEPFLFDIVPGQHYASAYIVGELHAEFVDEAEDTIATARSTLVWDAPPNYALKKWGQQELRDITSQWSEKRRKDNQQRLWENPVYQKFMAGAGENQKLRGFKIVERLVTQAIHQSPDKDPEDFKPLLDSALAFLEYDAFWEIAADVIDAGIDDIPKLLGLFKEWQIVEAKELARVTEGRIQTIEKLDNLIKTNALEVPTLHQFLKEFPWVIDPRWTLISDETSYSNLLREHFPESDDIPEKNRRIDFLCVKESNSLIVVEIKRPGTRVSVKDLNQIEEYVNFVRAQVKKTTDPERRYNNVIGYLLCGDSVDTDNAREKRENLEAARIYVLKYADMLRQVQDLHRAFLDKYNDLNRAKRETAQNGAAVDSPFTPNRPQLSLNW